MNEIQSTQDLEVVFEKSKSKPQLILKHSTQCPISAAGKDEVEKFLKLHSEVDASILLVIESRPVSNLLEEQIGVRHESPQVLVIKSGKCEFNASHRAITVESLTTYFDS